MNKPTTLQDKIQRGAADAGRYFRYMTEFVGFRPSDAQAIRESGLIIEKHLPSIVAEFYANLLRYPPTRKHFLKSDGSVDQDYLQTRMLHLTNFWRRTAAGVYDDEYARYVDYVGRAHTSHGADPNLYIAERYVIGQVGFMQHAITRALTEELREYDPDLERRAVSGWNKLMMVILEMLSRAYGHEREAENYEASQPVDGEAMQQLAVETYEAGLGLTRQLSYEEVWVGRVEEIPMGERKIVQVGDLSIGVFHHKGKWVAVRNYCLHRGGPVATGSLNGDVLVCPWHGYQYNLCNGQLLVDPSVKLDTYPVTIRDEVVYLSVPSVPAPQATAAPAEPVRPERTNELPENAFLAHELAEGQSRLVIVDDQRVAVYNIAGTFYATQDACTHADGPLSEGPLDGPMVVCPWHGSCFDVTTGEVLKGPARRTLLTYQVVLDGEIVRVNPKP